MTRNRLCLRILWLCSVLLLVIHINSGAGLGQSALTSFDDYRACPRHQRVAKPEPCELGVAWFRMTTLLPGFGAAQPDDIFVTVIIRLHPHGGLACGLQCHLRRLQGRIAGLRLGDRRGPDPAGPCNQRHLPALDGVHPHKHLGLKLPSQIAAGSPVPPHTYPGPHPNPVPPPPFSLLPASVPTVGAGYNLAYWVKADGQLGHDVNIVGR